MADSTTSADVTSGSRWADRKARRSTGNAPRQGGGAVYGLGMIGALAYFLGTADTGRGYALALGKAVVWPAILVYLAFRKLNGGYGSGSSPTVGEPDA